MKETSIPTVHIVGGGLAGLATAVALAQENIRVVILESRPQLGGRATSFVDPQTNELIDACQHVGMRCCTNWLHFCQTTGIAKYLSYEPTLHFRTLDQRCSRFRADPWKAPFHLARALTSAHFLTLAEKWRLVCGLFALWKTSPEDDPPLLDWLHSHGQTGRLLDRFWSTVLVSALNDDLSRMGLKYARKVFMDGFFQHRKAYELILPKVPLAQLYGDALQNWFAKHDVVIRGNSRVTRLDFSNSPSMDLILRTGEKIRSDLVVLAIPWHQVLGLLPTTLTAQSPWCQLHQLESSFITSVHLWLDRPITELPHVVLLDSVSQWLFARGRTSRGEWYAQVVISSSEKWRHLGMEGLLKQVHNELLRFFPAARQAQLLRSRVITDKSATFRLSPGVDRWRPVQSTNIPGLFLAGDWTRTGWPATMEGAVRSGYLAAEAIVRYLGETKSFIQPDLSSSHSSWDRFLKLVNRYHQTSANLCSPPTHLA